MSFPEILRFFIRKCQVRHRFLSYIRALSRASPVISVTAFFRVTGGDVWEGFEEDCLLGFSSLSFFLFSRTLLYIN